MASNINSGILTAFGLNAKKVTREKSHFICDTDKGVFKLARAASTPEHMAFCHQIKEHAASAGYPYTDRFRLTPLGQPFAMIAGEMWTATEYVKGREASFDNWNDFSKVIPAVRRWHICARGLSASGPLANVPAESLPLTEVFRKQSSELNSMAKRVRRQTHMSDFDVLFIKNVSFYSEQIKKALSLLEQSDYASLRETAVLNGHVCHNALKEENLIINNDAVYIINFAEATLDTQLIDIAALIRRYVRHAGHTAAPVSRVLEAVSQPEPLTQPEAKVLYALLLFPWNFMKTAGQYYSKKRTWTPNAMINRMQGVINEAESFNEYIKELEAKIM